MHLALSGQFLPGLKGRLSKLHETVELDAVLGTPTAGKIGILVTRGALHVDSTLLEKLTGLRKIVKAGSGLDTIDLETARRRGVDVVATGGSSESVADLAMALLFCCLRHVSTFDRGVRASDWQQKNRLIGCTLASRRIGIVGFGRIGRAFGGMGCALGAEVRAWDRSIEAGRKVDQLDRLHVAPSPSLMALVQECDVISLHLPLEPETTGILGRAEFKAMQPGTVLINTARAGIVDREALMEALSDGTLRAAGLDVHYAEGRSASDLLFDLPNVVLTPHVGAQTVQAHQDIADRIVAEVSAIDPHRTRPMPPTKATVGLTPKTVSASVYVQIKGEH
jgi:D-3-phosphoglycerate dehydrogenase